MENQYKITINEKGFIQNLKRLGYTFNQCFAELITNSQDANAKNIVVHKKENYVRIDDDGIGMDETSLKQKYDLMKQKNRDKYTTGCAGIGATASEFLIAKTKSIIITKISNSSEYLVAEVFWERAHKEFKLFDSINFRYANKDEIELFNSNARNSGTTTLLYYSIEDEEKINEILDNQFGNQFNIKDKRSIPNRFNISPLERFDIIFGQKNTNIFYKHWKNPNTIKLNLYNVKEYLCDEMNYKKQKYIIEVHRNVLKPNEYYYICENRIIDQYGEGRWKTTLSPYIKMCETNHVGNLVLYLYNPIHKERFDYENPKPITASIGLNENEHKYFNDDASSREFIQELQIFRNNHFIGIKKINFKNFNRNNMRANPTSANKLFYSRSFIDYFIESSEDDLNTPILDDIFGIQLNKNQNNYNTIPIPLERLIGCLIHEFSETVFTHFEDFTNKFNRNKEIQQKKTEFSKINTINNEIISTNKYNIEIDNNIYESEEFIKNINKYSELKNEIDILKKNIIELKKIRDTHVKNEVSQEIKEISGKNSNNGSNYVYKYENGRDNYIESSDNDSDSNSEKANVNNDYKSANVSTDNTNHKQHTLQKTTKENIDYITGKELKNILNRHLQDDKHYPSCIVNRLIISLDTHTKNYK